MYLSLFYADSQICIFQSSYLFDRAFPGGSVVKNPPANAGDVAHGLWLWRVGSSVVGHGLSRPDICGILSSRSQTLLLCSAVNYWTTREVPQSVLNLAATEKEMFCILI